ncbi:hypothetical protein ADUPG1_000012, partial [Aduncisulcus paluster]
RAPSDGGWFASSFSGDVSDDDDDVLTPRKPSSDKPPAPQVLLSVPEVTNEGHTRHSSVASSSSFSEGAFEIPDDISRSHAAVENTHRIPAMCFTTRHGPLLSTHPCPPSFSLLFVHLLDLCSLSPNPLLCIEARAAVLHMCLLCDPAISLRSLVKQIHVDPRSVLSRLCCLFQLLDSGVGADSVESTSGRARLNLVRVRVLVCNMIAMCGDVLRVIENAKLESAETKVRSSAFYDAGDDISGEKSSRIHQLSSPINSLLPYTPHSEVENNIISDIAPVLELFSRWCSFKQIFTLLFPPMACEIKDTWYVEEILISMGRKKNIDGTDLIPFNPFESWPSSSPLYVPMAKIFMATESGKECVRYFIPAFNRISNIFTRNHTLKALETRLLSELNESLIFITHTKRAIKHIAMLERCLLSQRSKNLKREGAELALDAMKLILLRLPLLPPIVLAPLVGPPLLAYILKGGSKNSLNTVLNIVNVVTLLYGTIDGVIAAMSLYIDQEWSIGNSGRKMNNLKKNVKVKSPSQQLLASVASDGDHQPHFHPLLLSPLLSPLCIRRCHLLLSHTRTALKKRRMTDLIIADSSNKKFVLSEHAKANFDSLSAEGTHVSDVARCNPEVLKILGISKSQRGFKPFHAVASNPPIGNCPSLSSLQLASLIISSWGCGVWNSSSITLPPLYLVSHKLICKIIWEREKDFKEGLYSDCLPVSKDAADSSPLPPIRHLPYLFTYYETQILISLFTVFLCTSPNPTHIIPLLPHLSSLISAIISNTYMSRSACTWVSRILVCISVCLAVVEKKSSSYQSIDPLDSPSSPTPMAPKPKHAQQPLSTVAAASGARGKRHVMFVDNEDEEEEEEELIYSSVEVFSKKRVPGVSPQASLPNKEKEWEMVVDVDSIEHINSSSQPALSRSKLPSSIKSASPDTQRNLLQLHRRKEVETVEILRFVFSLSLASSMALSRLRQHPHLIPKDEVWVKSDEAENKITKDVASSSDSVMHPGELGFEDLADKDQDEEDDSSDEEDEESNSNAGKNTEEVSQSEADDEEEEEEEEDTMRVTRTTSSSITRGSKEYSTMARKQLFKRLTNHFVTFLLVFSNTIQQITQRQKKMHNVERKKKRDKHALSFEELLDDFEDEDGLIPMERGHVEAKTSYGSIMGGNLRNYADKFNFSAMGIFLAQLSPSILKVASPTYALYTHTPFSPPSLPLLPLLGSCLNRCIERGLSFDPVFPRKSPDETNFVTLFSVCRCVGESAERSSSLSSVLINSLVSKALIYLEYVTDNSDQLKCIAIPIASILCSLALLYTASVKLHLAKEIVGDDQKFSFASFSQTISLDSAFVLLQPDFAPKIIGALSTLIFKGNSDNPGIAEGVLALYLSNCPGGELVALFPHIDLPHLKDFVKIKSIKEYESLCNISSRELNIICDRIVFHNIRRE